MSSNQKPRHNHRSGRQNNKQNNRGRNQNGRGGRKGPSKKQSQQPLTATRQVDSHGPAGKVRGNVKQLYEKYKALAHEVRTKDRTTSEAYGQYAHHYYTLYSEFAAAEAAQQVERENERLRKQQEAAENQSNIVPILDDDAPTSDASDTNEDTPEEKVEVLEDAPEKDAPKKNSKRKPKQHSPELPLEAADEKKPVRKARKPRKVKEEVAE